MSKSASVQSFLKELYRIWITERPSQFAASLAYYAIFSFVPVIYIAFAIAGIFIDELAAADQFMAQVGNVLGEEAAQFLQDALASLSESTAGGTTLTSLISFVVLLFSASLIIFQLQHTLNTIWKVPPPTRGETLAFIKGRLLAFVMVIGVGLLLILATIVNVAISILSSFIDLGGSVPFVNLISYVGLATISFALIYKFLPDVEIAWRDVWVGSAVTALLVTVGGYLVGFYLGVSKIGSALEAAGAVTVFLMAFYFLAQIFVFGAVLTRVYASLFGSQIVPREDQSTLGEASPGQSVHHER